LIEPASKAQRRDRLESGRMSRGRQKRRVTGAV
jgi:hypothetical protein